MSAEIRIVLIGRGKVEVGDLAEVAGAALVSALNEVGDGILVTAAEARIADEMPRDLRSIGNKPTSRFDTRAFYRVVHAAIEDNKPFSKTRRSRRLNVARCNDADMGNCSGRAYQRKGLAWWLCKRHWNELLGLLSWAAGQWEAGKPESSKLSGSDVKE